MIWCTESNRVQPLQPTRAWNEDFGYWIFVSCSLFVLISPIVLARILTSTREYQKDMFKCLTHHQLDLPAVKTAKFFRPRDLLWKFCVWLHNKSMETARICLQLTVFCILHTADVSFASSWLSPSTCISRHIDDKTLSQQHVYPVASSFRCYVWRNLTTKSTYFVRQRWTSLSLQLTGECKIRLLGAHRNEITGFSKSRIFTVRTTIGCIETSLIPQSHA